MKKSKLTAYKTAALCAALTALGIVMSLLESEAMVFSVFFMFPCLLLHNLSGSCGKLPSAKEKRPEAVFRLQGE